MNTYFNLYSTTFYIKEEHESALYNTLNGDIICLSNEQTKVLDKVLKGIDVKDLEDSELSFVTNMVKSSLGFFADKRINIEPSFLGNNKYFEKLVGDKRRIEILQIELTSHCNLNCAFCDENSDLVFRKTGCKKWYNSDEELQIDEWIDIIDQAVLLGCNRIEFFGGEPLLQWEKFCKIVISVSEKGINEIVLHTNGILINNETIEFIKKYNIYCVIQVIKASDNKEILGLKADYNYYNLLICLLKNNIKYKVALLVTKYNDELIDEYVRFFRQSSIEYNLDFIYPNPDNEHYSHKYKDLITDYRSHIIRCTPATLGVLLVKNPCYYNRIAFSADGKAYPCIMSRKEQYGSYRDTAKIYKFNEKLFNKYKGLNKEKYDICNACVYRYSCFTCAAIDMAQNTEPLKCLNCSKAASLKDYVQK